VSTLPPYLIAHFVEAADAKNTEQVRCNQSDTSESTAKTRRGKPQPNVETMRENCCDVSGIHYKSEEADGHKKAQKTTIMEFFVSFRAFLWQSVCSPCQQPLSMAGQNHEAQEFKAVHELRECPEVCS